jgi:Cell wall-associated hydrolases (invasion-associated proteins)
MCLALLSPASLAAESTSMGAIEVTNYLNVRSAPNTSATVVGKLVNNDIVEIEGKTGDWYEISLGSQDAYVAAEYVRIVSQEEASKLIQAANAKAADTAVGEKIVATAKQYIGTPYVYGGRSASGFDCSGFTGYVYEKNGISIPRTSASQSGVGTKVDKGALQAGDLVFFGCGGSGVNHVGIYVGDGQFIHSPSPGKTVRLESLSSSYYSQTYICARRVAN